MAFLQILVYIPFYILVSVLEYTITYLSFPFYTCLFYTCLNIFFSLYLLYLYLSIQIVHQYLRIHTFQCLLVWTFLPIHLPTPVSLLSTYFCLYYYSIILPNKLCYYHTAITYYCCITLIWNHIYLYINICTYRHILIYTHEHVYAYKFIFDAILNKSISFLIYLSRTYQQYDIYTYVSLIW